MGTANFISIMVSQIPSRKCKGLAMAVVPKIVEGRDAKYVTGSGQTKATGERVHIFEREGSCCPFIRGGRRKAKAKKVKRSAANGAKKKGKKRRPNTNEDTGPLTNQDTNQDTSIDVNTAYSFPSLIHDPEGNDDDEELMEAITILRSESNNYINELPTAETSTIDSELLMPKSVLNDPKYDVFAGYM